MKIGFRSACLNSIEILNINRTHLKNKIRVQGKARNGEKAEQRSM